MTCTFRKKIFFENLQLKNIGCYFKIKNWYNSYDGSKNIKITTNIELNVQKTWKKEITDVSLDAA